MQDAFFPTLTCGVFVFSAVSAPSPPASSRLSTHTHHSHIHHTHTYTHSHPVLPHTHHTRTHISHTYITHTHTHTNTHAHTHTPHTYITHTYTHTYTHSHTPHTYITHTYITHTHTHTHTYNHSHCVAGAALGALQGVGCTPWPPLVSAALPVAFAWQVRHLVHCKGSDVRPGVLWSPPLCRWRLRGRCGTWCSARVGCTPWHPLVSAALPVAFACCTWCTAKGSDVRPGVP